MPTSCIFSTDPYSMGQFLQDGARVMFETYVDIKNTRNDFYIEELEGNFDGLNFLAKPEHERRQPQGYGGHHPRPCPTAAFLWA